MTQQQIAILELALVAGLGAILFIAGILIKVFTDRKNIRCTSVTVGKVSQHSFMGDGRIAPVVEYEAGGEKYTCKKRFTGIKKVHSTRLDEPDAWEDEKGYLHVRTGILSERKADDNYKIFQDRYGKMMEYLEKLRSAYEKKTIDITKVCLNIVRMLDHGDDEELQNAIVAVNCYYQEHIYSEK